MFSRKSVGVTYAHKRRRAQAHTSLSSPFEVLPPETDYLTRTQMARRMLKRSRRVALAERLEDKNVEHIREHLAKRIKHNQERVEPIGVPQDDITFQTPFSASHSVHESAVSNPLVPEQLSPVPAAKRVMSRTSSRNLKENGTHSQPLASPFSSRPGSAASSPKHKGRGRPSVRRALRMKSRTLSGVSKENARRVSRKNSTVSLKDANKEPRARYIKHNRYPSSPSASYMRSQFAQEDWIVLPKALSSRTFDDNDSIPSPGGSVDSDASFYTGQPQSCSTPAISRLREALDPQGHEWRMDSFSTSFFSCEDPIDADVEMIDDTVPPQRQTIHLSGNSIFSTSDEFTIGTNKGESRNSATGRDKILACSAGQSSAPAGCNLAGSFVAEYDIPLSDMVCSPRPTASTKTPDSEDVPKVSVGERVFGLPGTSPAHGDTLIIRRCRKPCWRTPPGSPRNATAPCPPSSPASDLAQGLGSMDIRGDPHAHSDKETHHASAPIHLPMRSHSLQDAISLVAPTTKKPVKRVLARNRAGTIRASEFVKPGPGVSASGSAPGATASSLSNVRRTRSGTVVGPNSKLATKGAPATGLTAVPSGSESESDDELLLKGPWIEDVVYLGLAAPLHKEAESDDLSLLRSGSPRRLGLRRR